MAYEETPNLKLRKTDAGTSNQLEASEDRNFSYDIIDSKVYSEDNKVPVSTGLEVDTNLDMDGNDIVDVSEYVFRTNDGADTNRSLKVKSDGELYFVDGNGVETKITLNGNLDISSFGSIVGLSGSASLVFTSGNQTFTFNDTTGSAQAKLLSSDLTIDNGSNGTVSLTHSATVNRTLTLPDATGTLALKVNVDNAVASIATNTTRVNRKEIFNVGVTGDFASLAPVATQGASANAQDNILSIAMDRASEAYTVDTFNFVVTNEYNVTSGAGDTVVRLQSKSSGTLDNGWTDISVGTSTDGAAFTITALSNTAIPVGTFVRLRLDSVIEPQPSFAIQVNGTVTA